MVEEEGRVERRVACGGHGVATCVEIKFYGAFVLNRRLVLHAIDATPARWRGDADSSPLGRAWTAASSPRNDLVKNLHPSHLLISTQIPTGHMNIIVRALDVIIRTRRGRRGGAVLRRRQGVVGVRSHIVPL